MEGPTSKSLVELALEHGTDKAAHGYCDFYESLLAPRRDDKVRILELGVGGFERQDDPTFGGASLRMWRDYFPNSEIWALDVLDKHGVADERIHIIQGSQVDRALLTRLSEEHGPFDLIVDDASHIPSLTIESFEILFSLLADGGIYVIEDTSTSYWPTWGGRFRRRATSSTMGWVKDRIDGLNHVEWKLPKVTPSSLDTSIVEVRTRHGIVAFVKSPNDLASDQNRAHPLTYAEWIRSDVLPYAARKAHHPTIIRATELLGVRGAARKLRRTFLPSMDR